MITDICGMYILLAAATTLEIQPTIDLLEKMGSRAGGHETAVLITGVGSVAATHRLTQRVLIRRPDLLIQAGIAGGFLPSPSAKGGPARRNETASPGDVFAIKEEILADLGVWEAQRFKTLFDLQLAAKDAPPFSNGALVNRHERLLALSGLEPVRSITVNEITTDSQRIRWYQQNWSPVVESMEGGALHYVCLQEHIPFLQIRSISNYIGERDKTKWNIKEAIHNLNERLIGVLQRLGALDEKELPAWLTYTERK